VGLFSILFGTWRQFLVLISKLSPVLRSASNYQTVQSLRQYNTVRGTLRTLRLHSMEGLSICPPDGSISSRALKHVGLAFGPRAQRVFK